MYTFESRVRYSEVDLEKKLTLNSIINYLQDCTTFQSEELGVGVEALREKNRAWFLSFWQIVIPSYPKLGDRITTATWAYDFKSMLGYRNFQIMDEQKNPFVNANSIWVYLDTQTGRPVKPRSEEISRYPMESCIDMTYCGRKLTMPDGGESYESFPVRRYHIDTNHHVNNGEYIKMAMEYIPFDFIVRELRAEYKKAAVYGERIYPRAVKTEEGFFISLSDEAGVPYAVIQLLGEMSE